MNLHDERTEWRKRKGGEKMESMAEVLEQEVWEANVKIGTLKDKVRALEVENAELKKQLSEIAELKQSHPQLAEIPSDYGY